MQKAKIHISSARDLQDHRKEVMDACLRQSILPKMMEQSAVILGILLILIIIQFGVS
jgi:hypothetical protein